MNMKESITVKVIDFGTDYKVKVVIKAERKKFKDKTMNHEIQRAISENARELNSKIDALLG